MGCEHIFSDRVHDQGGTWCRETITMNIPLEETSHIAQGPTFSGEVMKSDAVLHTCTCVSESHNIVNEHQVSLGRRADPG